MLAEVLSEQSGHKVALIANPGGERRVWVAMAVQNAGLAIGQKLAQKATQDERLTRCRKRWACRRRRNASNASTSATPWARRRWRVASIFDRLAMQTSEYRRFNVKPEMAGDDYAAMREALTRRAGAHRRRRISGTRPAGHRWRQGPGR